MQLAVGKGPAGGWTALAKPGACLLVQGQVRASNEGFAFQVPSQTPNQAAFALVCRSATGSSQACLEEAAALQEWQTEREILAAQIYMFCTADAEVLVCGLELMHQAHSPSCVHALGPDLSSVRLWQPQYQGRQEEMDRACAGLVTRLAERMPEDWAHEEALRAQCTTDVERHCPYTPSGHARLHQCLRWTCAVAAFVQCQTLP